jgi:hypothetical protein
VLQNYTFINKHRILGNLLLPLSLFLHTAYQQQKAYINNEVPTLPCGGTLEFFMDSQPSHAR